MKIYLVAACLISAIFAQAATSETESVTIVKRQIIEGSSEANRLGKEYFLTGQVLGYAVAPVPAFGVNAGYFYDRNNLLQLEISSGVYQYRSFTTLSSSSSVTLDRFDFDMPATTVGANLKHFFGNSFYTKTGLTYRKIGITSIKVNNSQVGDTDVGAAESLAADIAIGNQWQWESFTMGCDWVGFMVPITTLSSRYSDSGYSESTKQELRDSWNTIAKITSSQLLRFYMGASF